MMSEVREMGMRSGGRGLRMKERWERDEGNEYGREKFSVVRKESERGLLGRKDCWRSGHTFADFGRRALDQLLVTIVIGASE
jgi:hypothetical protein